MNTVDNAYDESERLFYDVRTYFDDFYNALMDAISESKFGKYGQGIQNPYLEKIKKLAEPINDILQKKKIQQDKFKDSIDSIDHDKFYDGDDVINHDMEDMDLRYLQNEYPK